MSDKFSRAFHNLAELKDYLADDFLPDMWDLDISGPVVLEIKETNAVPECFWTWNESGMYSTECGRYVVLDASTPEFSYCPLCGKKVKYENTED